MPKTDVKIDWQVCALGLNKKLNLIAAKLKQSVKENPSFDIACYARELLDTFKLDTDVTYRYVGVESLASGIDDARKLCNDAVWATFSSKQHKLADLQKKLSALSMDASIAMAFEPLKELV